MALRGKLLIAIIYHKLPEKSAHIKRYIECRSDKSTQVESVNSCIYFLNNFLTIIAKYLFLFQDPEIAAALKDITTNPANILKHQNNPKVAAFLAKMSQKMGLGLGGMMGGLGGMMGGMGGFGGPGAGSGPESGPATGSAAPADIDVD